MTLDQFVSQWNGKQLEVAGSANAKFQCVDLANGYIRDVLQLPIIEWTDAKDFGTKAGSKYTHIKNTPTGAPQRGDLIVFNSLVGQGHGHIAVCLAATSKLITSFDQNWSQVQRCSIETHKYTDFWGRVIVDGWLRVKPSASPITDRQALEEIARLVNPATSPVGGDLIGKWRVKAVLAKIGL